MAEIENNAVAVAGDQAQPPPAEARRGRRRVEMKKMENEKSLQVTFCKRRVGLFKKASELVTLCGVEMALVIFSPSGKVQTFGNPSVDAVLERYSSGGAAAAGDGYQASRSSSVVELNARLAAMTSEVEAERKKGRAMNKKRLEAVAAGLWWEAPVETIQDPAQLKELAEVLENVKNIVKVRQDRITEETSATIATMAGPMYGNGGGGGFVSGGGQAPAVPFLDYKNDNINNIYNYNNTINNNNNNNNNVVPYPYYNNNDHGFFF